MPNDLIPGHSKRPEEREFFATSLVEKAQRGAAGFPMGHNTTESMDLFR